MNLLITKLENPSCTFHVLRGSPAIKYPSRFEFCLFPAKTWRVQHCIQSFPAIMWRKRGISSFSHILPKLVNKRGPNFLKWSLPVICRWNIRSYLYLLKLLYKRQHEQKHSSTHAPLSHVRYHVVQISGIFRTPFEFGEEMISRPDLVPFPISFGLARAKYHNTECYYEGEHGSWVTHRWAIDDTVVSQLVRHRTL